MKMTAGHLKYNTMAKWILTGCIILLIPILCAAVNFVINKRLLESKTDQLNSFMLKNIQYNIDSKLNDIQSISNYLLLDGNFNKYALNTNDTIRFHSQIDQCYGQLNLYYSANPDVDIMIYLPAKEFLLTTSTANRFPYVFGALHKQGRITGTEEAWKEVLLHKSAGSYLISEELSYRNYGKESLVYVAQEGDSGGSSSCCIFLSTSTDFLTALLERENQYQSTILIINGNQEVIGSYGPDVDPGDILWETPENTSFSFRSQGLDYMGCYAQSQVCSWKYLVCTPKIEYLKDIWSNTALNLVIILLSAVVGMAILIYLQWRNYRPLRNLVLQLPDMGEQPAANMDEFAMVEHSLKTLYHENFSMRNSLESRKEYEKEWFLLIKLRGGGNHCERQDVSVSEMVGCSQAQYFLISISANMEDSTGNMFADDFSLLSFSLQNVMNELFEGHRFLKTLDDMFFVYLFLFEREEDAEAERKKCLDKLKSLCTFFQNYFNVELAVTVGELFSSEGYISAGYAKVQEANEYRYFDRSSGVLETKSIKELNRHSPERLNYYNKRFESILVMEGQADAGLLAQELFGELHKAGECLEVMRYYVISIAADLLIVSQGMMHENDTSGEIWKGLMDQIYLAEDPAGLHRLFLAFLKQLCRAVEADSMSHQGLADTVREYVFSHYSDCNMNISSIAEQAGMTPRYLSRLFKEQTGTGLLDFINEVRIRQAEYLLKNTSGTVDEIAALTGYTNSRTFRRNFLKYTGESAVNYRRR